MPDVATIRALAPDDASLKAGSALADPSGWPTLGRETGGTLLWGECSGSGKNPYKVVVDSSDSWTRCSCPSRKFPCKHALGLMLLDAAKPGALASGTPTEWVAEWTSRRRAPAEAAPTAPVDEKTAAKRTADAGKRAVRTLDATAEAVAFLEGWISDRLRTGLQDVLADPRRHLETVRARLVDGKAASLAERVASVADRLPQDGSAVRALVRELGKTVLLAEAWRRAPEDPALAAHIGSGTTLAAAKSAPDARIETLCMTCIGRRSRSSSDGRLMRNDTWFATHGSSVALFAVVSDWGPKNRTARGPAAAGTTVTAEILWHPSRSPCRISILSGPETVGDLETPMPGGLAAHLLRLDAEPWIEEGPVGFGAGRFARSAGTGGIWFVPEEGDAVEIFVPDDMKDWITGIAVDRLYGIWDSRRLDVLAVHGPDLGRIHP